VLISGSGTNLQALIDACNTPRLPHAQIVLVLSNRKAAYGLARAAAADPPIPTAYVGLQPFMRANPGATRTEYDLAVAKEVLKACPDVLVLAGWMHIVSEAFLEVMRGVPVRAVPAGSPTTPLQPQQLGQPPSSSSSSSSVGEVKGADLDEGKKEDDEEGGESVAEVEGELRTPPREIPVINIHPALPGQFDGANAMERGFEAFQRGEVDRLGVMVHRVIAEVDRGAPVIVREVEVNKGEDMKNDYEPRMHRTEWEVIVEATKLVLDQVRPVSDCSLHVSDAPENADETNE